MIEAIAFIGLPTSNTAPSPLLPLPSVIRSESCNPSSHDSVNLNLNQHLRIDKPILDHDHRRRTSDLRHDLNTVVTASRPGEVVAKSFADEASVFVALQRQSIRAQHTPTTTAHVTYSNKHSDPNNILLRPTQFLHPLYTPPHRSQCLLVRIPRIFDLAGLGVLSGSAGDEDEGPFADGAVVAEFLLEGVGGCVVGFGAGWRSCE
jgi:hypothetical protein